MFRFSHVNCGHVKHDYAPIYTCFSALLPLHRTSSCIGCNRGHRLACIGCNTVHRLSCLDLLLSSVNSTILNTIAYFKLLEFKCFYFCNYFDTDCKKRSLAGTGNLILYDRTERDAQIERDNCTGIG